MKNTSKIPYDALQVEGLKEVLAQVSSACDELGIHFFIVGAIARMFSLLPTMKNQRVQEI